MAWQNRDWIEQRVDELMTRLVRHGDLALLDASALKVLVAVLGGLALDTGTEPADAWLVTATGLTLAEVSAARELLRTRGYLPVWEDEP